MTTKPKTEEDEKDIAAEYRADHATDTADPFDLLEQYPHAGDCAEFAELIPSGEIGSATGDWGFCPFCGDYI
jgi:hypothetical protein